MMATLGGLHEEDSLFQQEEQEKEPGLILDRKNNRLKFIPSHLTVTLFFAFSLELRESQETVYSSSTGIQQNNIQYPTNGH